MSAGVMKEFKFIRLAAPDSFGRGKEYGAQAAKEIGLCVETYREHFAHMQGLGWQDARDEAMRYLPLVSVALPEETEMLRGVAEGAGVDFEEIMVLNTRYEMLHYPQNECTTFAVLREATRDGKVFIGQNWDQRPMVDAHAVLLHMTMEDGTKIMGLTEAGQLPRNGVNSRGLGLAASSIKSSKDSRRVGIPGNFLRMRALRAKTFAEMTEVIAAFQREVAGNYCIASAAENLALDIEGIPGLPCVFLPENGIVTHANHILSHPELDTSNGRKFRGERLGDLLRQRAGEITADVLKECLRDHHGFPKSICSHPEEGADDAHRIWKTVASLIYDLNTLELQVCRGNPCEESYKTYQL